MNGFGLTGDNITTLGGLIYILFDVIEHAPWPEKWSWVPTIGKNLGLGLLAYASKSIWSHSTLEQVEDATRKAEAKEQVK